MEGYQYWSRSRTSSFPDDDYMSDSSDSSERLPDITRSEAARLYPEACHQALAATLGLVYSNIRNELERPISHIVARGHKRSQDEVISVNGSNAKPFKMRRSSQDVSPTRPHKIDTGFTVDSRSVVSASLDKLGWNANLSEMSEETMSKFKGLMGDEFNSALLKALERGRIKLKPGDMEKECASSSPSESAVSSIKGRPQEVVQNDTGTVPTIPMSPESAHNHGLSASDAVFDAKGNNHII